MNFLVRKPTRQDERGGSFRHSAMPSNPCLRYRHITFYAAGYTAWVDEIFVSPEARDSGIGKSLMNHFEEWAAQHGCRLVGLATAGASWFYERLGYETKAGYYKKYLPPTGG